MWTLAAAALLMLALCGFALLVSGFSRAQNVIHAMAGAMVLYCVSLLGYWSIGFAIQSHGLLFLRNVLPSPASPEFVRLPFFAMAAAIAVAIPAGALAERWRLISMLVVGAVVSMAMYPMVARSVWGGGWLSRMGASAGLGHGVVDFAGSGVVHLVGGLVGFSGAVVVGPRFGKFGHDGRPTAMPGHHVPMFMAGSLLIGAGWLGFVLGMGPSVADVRLSLAGINVAVAPAAAVVTAVGYMIWRFGTPDPSLLANAWLAGLVSVSAGGAFVSSWAAAVIGIVSGPLVIESVLFLERRRLDDPAGAVSVHGVCGAWGLLAVGLLANGESGDGLNGVPGAVRGLFYGDAAQFVAQAIGAGVIALFVVAASAVLFRTLGRGVNRVAVHAEREGLDAAELGTTAYPDFGVAGSPHELRR